ncbi:MAG: sensor domain-containing diguanylate cyclase [bacterium]
MLKNIGKNINSVKLKAYSLFIIFNLIVFSIGAFFIIRGINLYEQKYLREKLKSQLMDVTMQFINDRSDMLEKANDIVAHRFKRSFIQSIFPLKKISGIDLMKVKDGKILYFEKFKYRFTKAEPLKNYARFSYLVSMKHRHILYGFGRDKDERIIESRVVYRLLRKGSGYILILNRHITSRYLLQIRRKMHMITHIGIYYGNRRSAVTAVKNNKFIGIGQRATGRQKEVLKKGRTVYQSLNVEGIPFYIYNTPIYNVEGKIIGITGVGIKKFGWFWYIAKFYIQILAFLVILALFSLIFLYVDKRFIKRFYELLKLVKGINPDNPERLEPPPGFKNKGMEAELLELYEAIGVLNNAIIEGHKENILIVSTINDFSRNITVQDDINTVAGKLISIIVEKMGFDHSWFGVTNEAGREVKVKASYKGDFFTYAKNLVIKYDDSNYMQSLTGKALRAMNYMVINDVSSDETVPRYKQKLLEYNFLSAGAFPLIANGEIYGIIGVYSKKKNAFTGIEPAIIFNLAGYAAHIVQYLENLKRSIILSEMAENMLLYIAQAGETENSENTSKSQPENREFFSGVEENLNADFVEFIAYDTASAEITDALFSRGWDYNIGVSSITPAPTGFVRERVAKDRLDAYDYLEDDFATPVFKDMGVRDIILFAFKGSKNRRYLAVTGVKGRRKVFKARDMDFFRDAMTLFAGYYEINKLYRHLGSSLELLENREVLINKMVAFGLVSVNIGKKTIDIYNDYFASIFNIGKFSVPLEIDEFYEKIKTAFEEETFAEEIFRTYVKNRYVSTIDSVEIRLKSGVILSMKSTLFLTKDGEVIRLLVFENITDIKKYINDIERSKQRLNILYDLSYKLSYVFTLEYAIKTFAEGIYSIKKEEGGIVDSLHINIFDTVNKKTVTSLIYCRKENEQGEEPASKNYSESSKIIVSTNSIDYEDYLSNCKLLKNGKKSNSDGTVDDCEFRGTNGSYKCFVIKISDEVAGTVSIDSKEKNFFSPEITDLIKEIINIASPVFAKLILIETNKELAITDSLTGIHNRRFMYEFTKRELSRAQRNQADLSIVILDIDKFKEINDNFGHHIGDIMLLEFTNDLKNVLMRKQDLITRYGGDEFVIILPDTDKDNALKLMEKLRIHIKNKIYYFENNLSLNITVSIGVANLRSKAADEKIKNSKDPEEILNVLLKIADDNLYKAKDLGRDKVVG